MCRDIPSTSWQWLYHDPLMDGWKAITRSHHSPASLWDLLLHEASSFPPDALRGPLLDPAVLASTTSDSSSSPCFCCDRVLLNCWILRLARSEKTPRNHYHACWGHLFSYSHALMHRPADQKANNRWFELLDLWRKALCGFVPMHYFSFSRHCHLVWGSVKWSVIAMRRYENRYEQCDMSFIPRRCSWI